MEKFSKKIDGKNSVALILAVMVVAQLAITLMSFDSIDSALNDKPVLNVDFCSQYYWAEAARQFNEKYERFWGYDPYFMAGYPLSFVFNSALPVQMAATLFSDSNLARVIKVCFIVSFILVPLNLFISVKNFGQDDGPALSAAALGTVYFWVAENAFLGHMGMISGAFLLHFFMLPLSFAYRYLAEGHNRSFSFLFFAFAFSFTIHKTAFVLVAPLVIVWILIFSPRIKGRIWLMLTAMFGFAALFNLNWLYPFLKFLPLKIEDPTTTFFQNTDIFRLVKDLAPVPVLQPFIAAPLTRLIIVATAVYGIIKMKGGNKDLKAVIITALAFFGILTYLGSFIETLKHLQPYRYVTAFYYMWLPFSAKGLQEIANKTREMKFGSMTPYAFVAALVVLMVLPGFRHFVLVAPLTTTPDPQSMEMVEWIKTETDPSARVLIEDINVWEGHEKEPVYGGARLVHMIPLWTGRELIGGPLPNAFIKHHHAGFHDGILFDKPVNEIGQAELSALMDLYNVGWVVCWSDESKTLFDRHPLAKQQKDFGPLRAYLVARPHGFFLEGSGKARPFLGGVEFSEVLSEGGEVVISYHWVDGLECDPECELFRVDRGADPVGFIGVKNPPKSFTIELGL